MQAAIAGAKKAAIHGPSTVPLRGQATLALPKGSAFVPQKEADRVLRAMGNSTGPTLLGMVVPESDEPWIAVVQFIDAGYVKDDDARTWKADELLTSLKEGTEQQNEERRSRGIPEIEVMGWVQPPTYETALHRLVWSASTRSKGQPSADDQGVNYNTYVLGREGYVSLNLVTDLKQIDRYKPTAQELLAALSFNDGKKYADFDASTDKVAEYGLAALIGGLAAKKLGLFALIGVFLLKFWKIAALAFVGAGAVFFRKKKPRQAPPPPPA